MIDPHCAAAPRQGRLRAEFLFRLDPMDGSGFKEEGIDDRFCAWKRDVFKQFGVKMADKFWTALPSDHPRLPELIEHLEHLKANGKAEVGDGTLSVALDDDDEAPLEWFLVNPSKGFDLQKSDPNTVRACDMPPGVHLAQAYDTFVSETVKRVFEEQGVTGVELLWVRDTSRYAAPQWYESVGIHCLGRGLDHPWFDWQAYRASFLDARYSLQVLEDAERLMGWSDEEIERRRAKVLADRSASRIDEWRRHGARQVTNVHFKADWTSGSEAVDRFIRLFPVRQGLGNLTVVTFPRVLRSFVPTTDCAFVSGSQTGDAHDGDMSGGALCVNRRTRDLLVGAGVARPEEFLGVLVLDEVPPGSVVLDDADHPPPSPVSAEQLAAFRELERKDWEKFQARSRPQRRATLKRSLTMLRNVKAQSDAKFGKRASAKKLATCNAALPRPLPDAWAQVLKTADGLVVFDSSNEEFTCCATDQCPAFHAERIGNIADLDLEAPAHWLIVGHTGTGDLVALDTSAETTSGECPVLLVSHETHEEERRWESVAAFLEVILTG